jgi:hypothetical protein
MNQGVCRKGTKDTLLLENIGLDHFENNSLSSISERYSDNFEHCSCPAGYIGLRCEIRVDICPGSTHACFHGGVCSTTNNDGTSSNTIYECDCSGAASSNNDKLYAGSYCEMESTEFCTVDGMAPIDGIAKNSFCTNGGSCNGVIDSETTSEK